MKKEKFVELLNAIAAIIAIAAGIVLFFVGLCEEIPWRLLFTDMTILIISALVMRVTSDGMNFSIDDEEIDVY